jgi:energy-coupling factor transport system substrate-specific component
LSLILILTLVNALLGALVATIVYGGVTGTLPDIPVSALILLGRGIFSSAFLARILINIVDKGLPVMMIYIIYRIVEYKKGGNEDIDF